MTDFAAALDIPLFLLRVDRAAVDELTGTLLRAVHTHYDTRPKSRATILEAVHALAGTVAPILAGPDAGELRAAFLGAIARELGNFTPPATERGAGVIELPAFLKRRH
ncbi:MAG TPA: hypothetical protein VH020_16630 [Stellaceae bacterium]|nr:hypothetical protein [Stellaceae bacterium]